MNTPIENERGNQIDSAYLDETNLDAIRARAALQWPDLARYLDSAKIEPVLTLYGVGGQVMALPDYRDMLTVTVFDVKAAVRAKDRSD